MRRFRKVSESQHVRYVEYMVCGARSLQFEVIDQNPTSRITKLETLQARLKSGELTSLVEKTGVCYLKSVDREGCTGHDLIDDSPEAWGTWGLREEELERGWLTSLTLICGSGLPRDHDPTEYDDGIYDDD